MIRATARNAFDAAEAALIPLMARRPRIAVRAAATLGRWRHRLSGRWPSAGEIRLLFPHLSGRMARRVAAAVAALEARNRLVSAGVVRQGLEPVRPLVRVSPDLAVLRPPLLLVTFHVGAFQALGPALESLAGPVLGLRDGPLYTPRPPVRLVTTGGSTQQRAQTFHRLLAHLDRDGFVVMAGDHAPGRRHPPGHQVPCLGHSLPLARGPFAAMRRTGAVAVPLIGRWRREEAEIVVGERFAADGWTADPGPGRERYEKAVAASAGRWLERYLLRHPFDLGLGMLRALLYPELSPPATGC